MLAFVRFVFLLQSMQNANTDALLIPSATPHRPNRPRSHPYQKAGVFQFTHDHKSTINQLKRKRIRISLESNNHGDQSANTSVKDTNSTVVSSDLEFSDKPFTTTKTGNPQAKSNKWKADNFERDYQLLQNAIARDKSLSNLQQLQRKYTLDHGFRRHPLFENAFRFICNVGVWIVILIACKKAGAGNVFALQESIPLWRKACIIFWYSIVTTTNLHYWTVVMSLPLLLLVWTKSEEHSRRVNQQYKQSKPCTLQKLMGNFGPSAWILDAYFEDPQNESNLPLFFYSLDNSQRSKKRDTKDFVLCLLENWSSAVIASFIWRLISTALILAYGSKFQPAAMIGRDSCTTYRAQFLPILSRLITRMGAAAALYQFPQQLFELYRKDQPRPICRSTSIMQRVVRNMLRWLPIGISTDLTLLSLSSVRQIEPNSSITGFAFSIIAPLCHLTALSKLIRISKSNDVSLSTATNFPEVDCIAFEEPESTADEHETKWRYQILWRTPQRIAHTLRIWMTYLVTNHKPFLSEMDEWKSIIRNDGFSTEGIQFTKQKQNQEEDDDLLAHKDEIIESLSLILRDREAAITNATNVRYMKHQESYDSKELDDVLGVAVQQTFGLGLSYDFEHFDIPDENNVSIHQLRARMAKSAIREKKKLDNKLSDELALLHRLKDNISTGDNDEAAVREMKATEKEIRGRYNAKVERIKSALTTLIPINAKSPEGIDSSASPIMVAEYVNLRAPVERSELKATVVEAPDPLLAIEEYTRRNFGDEAADSYRQEELAFRQREKERLNEIRQRNDRIDDEGKIESAD